MIIVTDLLIIDHLISVSVTLLYSDNSLPYFILNLKCVSKNSLMSGKQCRMTLMRRRVLQRLILVYTVRSGESDQIHTERIAYSKSHAQTHR